MDKEKRTLVVNYPGMNMGGIEKYLSKLMTYCIENGHRVIWITTKKHYKNAFFSELVCDNRIEKCFYKVRGWGRHSKIMFSNNEIVTMLSFEPLFYARGEQFAKKYKNITFYHFLALPHFTGNAYYPERFLKGLFLYKNTRKYYCSFAHMLWNNHSILGFNKLHITSYLDNYMVKIGQNAIDDYVLPSFSRIDALNKELIINKANERNNKFRIISCSRLDFPHKGYILGLIDLFKELNNRYNHLELIIVGDGPGRNELEQKISVLPKTIANNIRLTGNLLPEQLEIEMNKAHLNIGVAGALRLGATLGVPSLTMRHYVTNCETYGFIGDDGSSGLKTDKGVNPLCYIEDIITCDNDNYFKRAMKDYDYTVSTSKYNPKKLFSFKNKNVGVNLDAKTLRFAHFLWYYIQLVQIITKRPGYDNE